MTSRRLMVVLSAILLSIAGFTPALAETLNMLSNSGAELTWEEGDPFGNRGPAFAISYAGIAATATVTIDEVNKRLVTTVDDVIDLNLDLTLPAYDNLYELIAYINALPNYSAYDPGEGSPADSSGSLIPVESANILSGAATANVGTAKYSTDSAWQVYPEPPFVDAQANRTFTFARSGNYSFYAVDLEPFDPKKVYHWLTTIDAFDEKAAVVGLEVTFSAWVRSGNAGPGYASISLIDYNSGGDHAAAIATSETWQRVSVTHIVSAHSSVTDPDLVGVFLLPTGNMDSEPDTGEAYFDDLSLTVATRDLPFGSGWTLFSIDGNDPVLGNNPVLWSDCLVTDGTISYTISDAEAADWLYGTVYYLDSATQSFGLTPGDDDYLRWYRGCWIWAEPSSLTLQIPWRSWR